MTVPQVQVGTGVRDDSLPRAGLGSDKQLIMPGQERQASSSGDFLIPVGTHWVERDVLMVSEEVARRWPNLAIVSCNCGKCDAQGHYPHMVVEKTNSGRTVPVLGFMEFGRHIIEQLSMAEQSESADLLERMRKQNEQQLESRHKLARERSKEASEVLRSALSSNKQEWIGPGGVRTDPRGRAFAGRRR